MHSLYTPHASIRVHMPLYADIPWVLNKERELAVTVWDSTQLKYVPANLNQQQTASLLASFSRKLRTLRKATPPTEPFADHPEGWIVFASKVSLRALESVKRRNI
jgi:hypothetical protein